MPTLRRPQLTLEHGLAVRQFGGDGAAVVWIHGLGESGRCFDAIVDHPRLRHYTHTVIDLPNYGRAPAAEPQSIAETAAVIAVWMRDRSPAVLIGHSLGGVLATLVAGQQPSAVRGMIDVEGNVSLGDCTLSHRVANYSEADFVAGGYDHEWRAMCAQGDDAALRGYAASLAFADPRALWQHSVDLVARSRHESRARDLAALTMPLAFVAGTPRGICQRSRDLLCAVGIVPVDVGPAGHWPFIDQPDQFAIAVDDFMRSAANPRQR